MRAIVFRKYGKADVLEQAEVPDPSLSDDEVLVRVAAAGVNPLDWRLRSGELRPVIRLDLPFTTGTDVAGVVEAVGPSVASLRPGDRVFAMMSIKTGGGYAERAAVKEAHAARLPESVSFVEGAAVPLAGLTALQALRDLGGVKSGQAVLINGGSGGVGVFSVQLAKAMGATVTAVCSGPNVPFVRDLGADEVIDYKTDDVFAGPRRFDVFFDTIASAGFRRWRSALKADGTLVTVNPIVGKVLPRLVTRALGINRLRSIFVEPSGTDLRSLAEYMEAGKIVVKSSGLSRWSLLSVGRRGNFQRFSAADWRGVGARSLGRDHTG